MTEIGIEEIEMEEIDANKTSNIRKKSLKEEPMERVAVVTPKRTSEETTRKVEIISNIKKKISLLWNSAKKKCLT